MKILVLTPRFPLPVIGGDKLRIYYVCKELKRRGFDLTLLSFVENDEEIKKAEGDNVFSKIITVRLPKWRSYLNTLLGFFAGKSLQTSYYSSSEMHKKVIELLFAGAYSGVLAHLVRMAPYIENAQGVKKVLEMTDAISLNYKRSREQGFSGLMSLIYRIEEKRVLAYEKECLKNFDYGVVVSKIDADWLNQNTENKYQEKVKIMGNGVMESFLTSESKERDPNLIIFEGNLRTHQNEDAVLYFAHNIFEPLIREKNPVARFEIVGASPTAEILDLANKDGIEVKSDVPDIRAELEKAAVSVVPMRIGAGIQNKVLESIATGTAVVTTAVGAEGIEGANNGEHFIIENDPQDFAEEVIALMKDEGRRRAMGEAGRKLIRENYTFEKQLAGYSNLFK